MSHITGHHFVIAVPDLQKSSAFYRDVRASRFAGSTILAGWLLYDCGDCTIMAGECPDAFRLPTWVTIRTSPICA